MNTRNVKLILAAILAVVSIAQARIKLVALPERAATVIRLDNPNATLIEEERVLTLQAGINKVDFSWKAVSIDADSIVAVKSSLMRVRSTGQSLPQASKSAIHSSGIFVGATCSFPSFPSVRYESRNLADSYITGQAISCKNFLSCVYL